MRRLTVGLVVSIVLAVASPGAGIGLSANGVSGPDLAGISLVMEPDPLDPALVWCRVEWRAAAESARLEVRGAEGLEVVAEPSLPPVERAHGGGGALVTVRWAVVEPGQTGSLLLDLRRLAAGNEALVVAMRRNASVSHEVVVHLVVGASRVELSPAAAYRLTEVPRRLPPLDGSPDPARGPVIDPRAAAVLVESLGPKIATTAEIEAEDAAAAEVPDGPWDCSDSSAQWGVQRWIEIDGAPEGALISMMALYVILTHSSLADVQVAFFKGSTNGAYLWNRASGANLNQSFTTDVDGDPLPGLATDVNGTYSLAVRDCAAGSKGTLDYWAVHVEYSATGSVDLVADSVAATPASVEQGEIISVDWAGSVAGTASVGRAFSVGFYLSSDPTLGAGDTLLGQQVVRDADQPGDTFGGTALELTVPTSTAPGLYYLVMQVDDLDDVVEVSEGNNAATHYPLTVTSSGAGCTADANTLCLANNRFRVTADWETTGDSGSAGAVELTGNTGYFWFFNQNNVELVVKVLDGCPVNGEYWVFAAGLTNVEVTLTVEDTSADELKVYVNQLGDEFAPIQDTAAFATCP